MSAQEELLDQIIALIPAFDPDASDEFDEDLDDLDVEEQERREAELIEWASDLNADAIPVLLDIIKMPQEKQDKLSPNGNGNEICGVAIDALALLGERHPEEVASAFRLLLEDEDTQALALEGIAIWESPVMLPTLGDLLENTEDPEIAYLIGAALFAIGDAEAVRLLKRILVRFADHEDVVEQTEQALEMLED